MLIETPEDLDNLLSELRAAGSDHQWVEAKKARGGLPQDLWKSLSAFANDGGGLVLLGVDEGRRAFDITGLEDAGATAALLQSLCSQAEPPFGPPSPPSCTRAEWFLPPTSRSFPREQQPCHFPHHGDVHQTSYIRVGDADMDLKPAEVDEILVAGRPNDFC